MTRLSINLNKFALLRNSRGIDSADIRYIASLAISGGCKSITLHPRSDERHATLLDVATLSDLLEVRKNKVELNIEGDLRDDLIDAVLKHNVAQFTIVPVRDGELTTERGFAVDESREKIIEVIGYLKSKKEIRISLFIEPEKGAVNYAHSIGCDAVEFHTKFYAKAFCTHDESFEINKVCVAAGFARELGVGIHLGHDLNLANISAIMDKVRPDEVSVGHALILESLLHGFPRTLKRYMNICSGTQSRLSS